MPKISALPLAGPLTGPEELPLVQDGTTKRASLRQVAQQLQFELPVATPDRLGGVRPDGVGLLADDQGVLSLAPGVGQPNVGSLPAAAPTSAWLTTIFDPAGAPARITMRDLSIFLASPQARLHPYGHQPNPTPTAKMDLLRVGAAQQFGEIAQAIAWANDGATILVDDGIYYQPAHSDVNNLTIQSVSGNPYRCYLDGEGGIGGGRRLSFGKGMLHLGRPTTIVGVGFRHCGGVNAPVDEYSSEAGVYAEGWPAPGKLILRRCAFDGNGNGVFIPHGGAGGSGGSYDPQVNIAYEEYECLFAYVESNSLSNPLDKGPSHDRYIGPISCLIDGSYMYGNLNGHSVKSGAPTTIIRNVPWLASWGGRAVETPYGGTATVTNSVLVSRGDALPSGRPAAGNFIGVADEVTTNPGNSHTYTDCTFHIGRGGDLGGVIFMPNGGTLTADGNTVVRVHQYGRDDYSVGFLHLVGNGTVSGLPLDVRLPASDPSVTGPPVPPAPPSWAFV